MLLLDDVLSELDLFRQKALLKAVQPLQTILTCTEFDSRLVDYQYAELNIQNSKISAMEINNAK